jgi:hypothetical protein
VTVGDDAYTGAGSVITEDVPPGALGIARRAPAHIEGYAERVSRREREFRDAVPRSSYTPQQGERAAYPPRPEHPRWSSSTTSGSWSSRAREPELAHRIASKLGVELGAVTLKTFSNGEVYCRYDESMRGGDVFIVSRPAATRARASPPTTR